ncbi:uncharacterized protein [Asterias amurensis]|uniref:uncharacterized protein isoform X1 n=1 Tax=Asterias amurensis TaxID=7602 RepID=UPI003AB2A394
MEEENCLTNTLRRGALHDSQFHAKCDCLLGKDLGFTGPPYGKQHVTLRGYNTIKCPAINFCRVEWLKDSKPYPWDWTQPNGITLTEVGLEDDAQVLKFKSAYYDARGVYTCVIFNDTHSLNRSTKLQVDRPFWYKEPVLIGDASCRNQTANIGENITLSCSFYAGGNPEFVDVYWLRPNVSSSENQTQWLSLSASDWGLTKHFSEPGVSYIRNISRPLASKPPTASNQLRLVGITEEAYGQYIVRANNNGLLTEVFLIVSSPPEDEHDKAWLAPIFIFAFVTVLFLLVKMMAVDAKLWYSDKYGLDEQDDGKLYDAYISYSWNEADREFVLNVLLPYLEKFGYNVFIPEIHTIPSNVFLEELSRALTSSRRFIMVITPSYTSSQFSQYEVHHATDVMSSKLATCIIPILMGVSLYKDSSPLSCPSSPTSISTASSSLSLSCSSSSSQDSSSSDCSSEMPSPSYFSPSSKKVKMDFRLCPLLGQLLTVVKPIKTSRKVVNILCNYNRFLKKLRLRMPKPPGRKQDALTPLEMVNVPHNKRLVDNEVLPEEYVADDGYIHQGNPKMYPMGHNINVTAADRPRPILHPELQRGLSEVEERQLHTVIADIHATNKTSRETDTGERHQTKPRINTHRHQTLQWSSSIQSYSM